MEITWKKDCKSFVGGFVCDVLKSNGYKHCGECNFYNPYSKKVLIVKTGSLGDVLRTTCLIPGIRRKYGENAMIYWLVFEKNKEPLLNNPYIDKLLIYNQDTMLRLQYEEFDAVFSMDTDLPSIAIANLVKAKEKFGYYFDKTGNPSAINKAANYYLETAQSDYLNKKNRKSYPEMIYEIAELKFEKDLPILSVSQSQVDFGKDFLKKNNVSNKNIIGINIGSAPRWPSKVWHNSKVTELIKKIKKNNHEVVILAGPSEVETLKNMKNELKKENISIIHNDPNNSLHDFISVLNICNTVITGDSLHLHLATALKKKIVALFFCTPHWEIEDYGIVKKVISPLFENYFFADKYVEELVNSISAEQVYKEI
ncbi:MAG TPA: glycosyltransferase family 9 protein [Candidatus Nanoarchaeia archaeon]|nr:glycosyltransferase family 9 protein [Candidatus Nanoarchaeia archaeon]